MSDSNNIEFVINTEHSATDAPHLSEMSTSHCPNHSVQTPLNTKSENVFSTSSDGTEIGKNADNAIDTVGAVEPSNVENEVSNEDVSKISVDHENEVAESNVFITNDAKLTMPINHSFSRLMEASSVASKHNVPTIGHVSVNNTNMAGGNNANIHPVGGYGGVQLDSSQNLQQIQGNNIGNVNIMQPTGTDLINQHHAMVLNALQQQLQVQKSQQNNPSQNQQIQNNQLQTQQLFNALISQQPQVNPLMFQNPMILNALHPGSSNPVGIPPLPPPGHPSIGLQPFPMHPLLLSAVIQAQQAQQAQQMQHTSQEAQQILKSPPNSAVNSTKQAEAALTTCSSVQKATALADEVENSCNTGTSDPAANPPNDSGENVTEKTDPTKNIDLSGGSPQVPGNKDIGDAKLSSPSLIPNVNQLPPTMLPISQPHQGVGFPHPGIPGQNALINPLFMFQRMVSPNSLYLNFNPQMGTTGGNNGNGNGNGNNNTGNTIAMTPAGILPPNPGHMQIPNISLMPQQGLMALAGGGIPGHQIPQMLNFINGGAGVMSNGEFFGQGISGGAANFAGTGGGFLMENDLERLHNHAESLVKTLLETSVPKAGIKLRLEWDKKRYCFKFTVYQVEEVTDSLEFQKKRMIPIDQDELFVNVNASKQLNIDNIEKAMWSAFVSVRHTLAKYCDRQAGQRRQSNANLTTPGAACLSRNLVQNNLIKMEDNGSMMVGGTGGKTKAYKKDELGVGSLIGLNQTGEVMNGKHSYKTDSHGNGGSSSGIVSSGVGVSLNGRGRRGGVYSGTTTTRSGRFVSLKYGYDDLMLSDDEGATGIEQEYVNRKGRKPKYSNHNIAVGGGSSSGEDNNHNIISNNISSTSNRYAKTYITTHRGRRGGNSASSNGNTGLGIYKTRGSGLSPDIYNDIMTVPSSISNAPIFVLQKDEPGKNHSLVGLYADWVDKHTIWDPRKGPLKTIFVSEGFNNEDFNADKRDVLKFTTNNYIRWDPSHIITDLRSIHIPISIAGEYFGLLRRERTSGDNESYIAQNSSDDINGENNIGDDNENCNVKNLKEESITASPITIKGNNVPNANQIRFVPNNEKYRNLLVNPNNSSINEMNEKYLEEKLFDLEAVDSVLVLTIQTTAALEQRKKKENKNSSITSIPTGSFLASVFSHSQGNNNENSDSTNEDENLVGGGDRITISNVDGCNVSPININNEEIQEYKHLILRFMHQQNGDSDFLFKDNSGNSMLNDNGIEAKDNSNHLVFDLNNSGNGSTNSLSKSTNRMTSRGLKRRGTMKNHSTENNNLNIYQQNITGNSTNSNSYLSTSNNEIIGDDNNNNILTNNGNAISNMNSIASSDSQLVSGSNGNYISEEAVSNGCGMFGTGAIAASAMLETLITSVRGSSSDKYRQQQMSQAYPQNKFIAKKRCRETNEILAKYVNDLANQYCNRNFGSNNLADGYINAFNRSCLKKL